MDSFQRFWPKSNTANYDRWKVVSLSILAATTFWFFNALNKSDYTTTINYPIELSYPGSDSLLVVGELPRSVRINVTGGGWNLIRKTLGIGTELLKIDISAPTDTRFLLGNSLTPLINDQIPTFHLNSVITDSLHFHIEQKGHRYIPLVINEVILAENQTLMGVIQIEPDTLEVIGPESLVNSLPDSMVIELSKQNITGNYQEKVAITFDEDLVSNVEEVLIKVNTTSLLDQEGYFQVYTTNFPVGYLVKADTGGYLVKYAIPSNYVDSVRSDEIKLFVDFNEMTSDSTLMLKVQWFNSYVAHVRLDTVWLPVYHKNTN